MKKGVLILSIWAVFTFHVNAQSGTWSVPEPSAPALAALGGMGLLAILARRRRR